MKRNSPVLGLLLVVLASATTATAALGRPDVVQPYADASLIMPPGLAQSFTVARTGNLNGFALTSPAGAPVVLQVYSLRPDGTPDVTHPLLPQNQKAALMPGAATIVSVTPIPVKRGEKLALALGTVRSTTSADVAIGTGDRYPGGQLFQVSGAFAFQPVPGSDLTFKPMSAGTPRHPRLQRGRLSRGRKAVSREPLRRRRRRYRPRLVLRHLRDHGRKRPRDAAA